MKDFFLYWHKSIDLDNPDFDLNHFRIINQGATVGVISGFLFLPMVALQHDISKTLLVTVAIILCLLVLYFYSIGKYLFSKIVITSLFPMAIACSIVLYGHQVRSDYTYFAFLVLAFILHKTRKMILISSGFIISLFIAGEIFLIYFEPIYKVQFSIAESLNSFFTSLIVVIVGLQSYRKNEESNQQKMETTLHMLNEQNKALATANQELERFAYIASHDLKTPLRTMVSYIGLMEHRLKAAQYNELGTYMGYVKTSGHQMHELINGILDFSRMNFDSKMDTEQIDLNDVLNETIQKMKIFIEEKNAKITAPTLPKINANSWVISVLFQNLIENGIKYNEDPNPEIVISFYHKPTLITFSFKDNGIGIEPTYYDRIFNLFERLDSVREGTGIGLGICKKIIDKLNGRIWLESTLGKGSTFYIDLPLEK